MRVLVPLLALALPLAVGSAAAQSNVTYYLHATGQCGGGGEIEFFMDHEDSSGDLDGCGQRAPAAIIELGAQYPGKGPLNASIPKDHAAEAHVFLVTDEPGEVSIDVSFSAGSASCAGSSETKQLTNAVVLGDYTEFVVPCQFSAAVNSSATPGFSMTVNTQLSYYVGYEGDHASRIELGALSPASPTNSTGNATQSSNADTPGPLALSAILALGFVGVAAHGRRRA